MYYFDLTELGELGPFKIVGDRSMKYHNVGLVDNNRKMIISPDMGYQSFIDYHDGLIIANKPSKNGPGWMVIDYLGNPISEGYTFIRYAGEGCYDVEKGSRHNLMRRDGSFVLEEWPHRVSLVYNGYFTFGNTIRKTKTTPTRYVEGLAHVSGLIVFPMIFEGLHNSGNDGVIFSAKYNGEQMFVHSGAVYDPSKKHYPSLEPESLESRFGDLIEKSMNWIIPGLQFFYRDTDAPIDIEAQYPIGKVIRSGFFVDMSAKLLKPAHKTRFLIAAAHAAHIGAFSSDEEKKTALGYSPKAEEWNHAVLHKNTWLKVLDVYRVGDVTQIFLLQIPQTAAKFLGDEKTFFKFVDGAGADDTSIVDMARQSLDTKLRDMVHPRSLDTDFTKRMHHPIGYDANGLPYSLDADLTPYMNDVTLSDGTPGLFYSRYIHGLAEDQDVVMEFDGFPWQGVVGSVCEGCMYASGTNGKPFGCGRLFEKDFRTNYIKGDCIYFKKSLPQESLFEYRERIKREKVSKKVGTYAERLLQEFIDERLGGNIDALATFDFSTFKGDPKYGGLKGPDMVANFAIVKSIMEEAFGEYWPDLNVDSLDVYTYQTGTLINTQRLAGLRIAERKFKCLTDSSLIDMAEDLHSLITTIGNYMVWPNKALMHNLYDTSKMRGYIDRLFTAMYDVANNAPKQNMDVKAALYKNRKLMKDYQGVEGFHKFMKVSLLEDFLDENGIPKLLFDGISNAAKDYNPMLLPAAIKQYHDFMAPFIHKRTLEIVKIIKTKMIL